MPKFLLGGATYDYVSPKSTGLPEDTQSWEYGHWPRVDALVPLTGGGTVSVFGEAMRWNASEIAVRWRDDEGHYHSAWLAKANVRRLTASEWDIIEYHQTTENLRPIRWGNRLPGFLPE